MTDPCALSVIVPVYNGADFLEECIASVLSQTFEDFELLIVDDGSKDDSIEIVKRAAAGDGRVHLLRHPNGENRGVSHSRQLGVSRAQGRCVAFLDADDRFEPEKLARQLEAFDAHPDCVLCHTAITAISSDMPELIPRYEAHFNGVSETTRSYRFHERPDALKNNIICNPTAMMRTEALRRLQFATPQLFQFEDFLLWMLLSLSGPFLYLPERLTCYRIHQKSAMASVMRNRLVELYSRMEFLFSLLALSQDESIGRQAQQELMETSADLIVAYADSVRIAEQAPRRLSTADWSAFAEVQERSLERQQVVIDRQREDMARLRADLDRIFASRTWRATRLVRRVLNSIADLVGRTNGKTGTSPTDD